MIRGHIGEYYLVIGEFFSAERVFGWRYEAGIACYNPA